MKKILPIIILTVISALLIFYRFVDIPKNLAFDEVEFAKLALSLQDKTYASYSTLATGHSTLYFYILATSLKLFGINTFALRLPAAIFGVLSVLMFYFIVKQLKKYELLVKNYNILPFLLAVIFLTSRWFLNFSRFSFEATFLLFLELVSIYCLISFWQAKRNQNIFLLFSGLFAGLAYNSYTPGRIFFLLPLFYILFHVFNSKVRRKSIKNLLLFLIPFVIIITPLTSYLMTHQDSRIDQQFFLRNHEMTINEKADGLWSNISSTALMLFIKGDMNGRHNYPGKPALNPILGILFIIGLVITIKQWNNNYNKLFLFYFLLSILPALMTYPWENPNMLRTYTVLPSVVFFIGTAILNLHAVLSKMLFNKKIFVFCFLFLVILFSSFYELRTYFKYQFIVFNQSFQIKLPLEKAIKVKILP